MNNNIKRNNERGVLIEKMCFLLLLLTYSSIMYYLFYKQAISAELNVYFSDMKAYMEEVLGQDSGYSFPYPLFFVLGKLFLNFMDINHSVALVSTLLNSLSIIFLIFYFSREVNNYLVAKEKVKAPYLKYVNMLLVFSFMFMSMTYSPKGHAYFGFDYAYRVLGIYTPNPFWNATYMATRPFTIVCFWECVKLLNTYEKKLDVKNCVLLGIFSILTTITKPSFTLVMAFTLAFIMLIRLIMKHFKNFKQTFFAVICFLPTGFILLYQFFGVFDGSNNLGEETGIGFAINKAWSFYSNNIVLSIVMALAFPLCVLIFNFGKLRVNRLYRFAWELLLVSFVMLLCLYEKGFRMVHMNFSWGYMHGLFFLYIASTLITLQNTFEWKKWKKLIALGEWGVFCIHLICGINFFVYMLQGNNYADF